MGKIYTKKGDRGNTKTFRGGMSKSDPLAEALGSVDELNSWIGVVVGGQWTVGNKLPIKQLHDIQTSLMKINAQLAGAENKNIRIQTADIRRLERWIDTMTKDLPELTNFVYLRGEIHIVRAVCRRAERNVVKAIEEKNVKAEEYKKILKYLNRLSDYLFTLARWVNMKKNIKEEVWKVNRDRNS